MELVIAGSRTIDQLIQQNVNIGMPKINSGLFNVPWEKITKIVDLLAHGG